MKIGIFDSGIGGLLVTKAIVKKLPQYDYIYLGDTKHVPYGDRSQQVIYEFTKAGIEYLFKQNCKLVIIACNTASTRALRKIQRQYLPKYYPDRRVLGIIVPTAEAVAGSADMQRIGVLATQATVNSKVLIKEIKKSDKKVTIYQQAAPLLTILIEKGGLKWADPILKDYLKPLLQKKVNAILLACTHYPVLKSRIRKMVGKNIKVISQDEIVPIKLKDYLKRHREIESKLSRKGAVQLLVTDLTPQIQELAKKWFGRSANLKLVSIKKSA